MENKKITNADVNKVFKKLNIPDNNENQNFEIWEVTPLKKGTRIFFESC